MQVASEYERRSMSGEQARGAGNHPPASAPHVNPTPKSVAFELLLDGNSKVRARIPMRVQIYPHDTTDSIVTTVKNFYGIYDSGASGVSFEDESGITLIARYENLRNNMTVYVRVIPIQKYPDMYGDDYYASLPGEARKHHPYYLAQSSHGMEHDRSPSRTASKASSKASRKRSASPSSRGRRSVSHNKQARAGNKSRGSSAHDNDSQSDDSDSTYLSKKGRSEHFASSDISMDNILQDGRRKRPKFESSVSIYSIPSLLSLLSFRVHL